MRQLGFERALLKEIAARKAANANPIDVLSLTFSQQRAFIEDKAALKCCFCTRRAAKSYSGGLYALHTALSCPGSKILYLALTRISARAIFWNDVLKDAARRVGLQTGRDITYNESRLEATLSNGSVIVLLGVDSDEGEKQKLLGQKYKLVLIDEAASFTIDLRQLVYEILKPAVADARGQICLLGTPGNLTNGLFFDVTHGTEPGWTLHRWNTFDNPHMREQWAAEIEEIRVMRPLFLETASYRQMYLGEWAIDEDALVYRYLRAANSAQALPAGRHRWSYVLGVDLGFNDDTALVTLAYADSCPTLFVVDVFKQAGMDITDVAKQINRLNDTYDYAVKVCDGANKQAVQELNNRHGLGLIAANKTGKEDFIQIMNDEFIQCKVQLLPAAQPLADEYVALVWHTRGTKRIEHPNLPNHAADAALYAWRYTYTYIQNLAKPEYKQGTPEYEHHLEEKHLKKLATAGADQFPQRTW